MRIYKHTVKKSNRPVTMKKWYADVRLSGGKRVALPLFESKGTSQKFADRLEKMISQFETGGSFDKHINMWLSQLSPIFIKRFVKWGLVEQSRIQASKSIEVHIKDYVDHLRHKGNTAPYCRLCETRIGNIVAGCKFYRLADIDPGKVMRYVSEELKANRLSQSSINHYIRQFKGFVRWLYHQDRISTDINKHLHLRTITEFTKHRRPLSIDEISYLLNWLATQAGPVRSLSGWERMVLYKLALTTGLRASEIRQLKVSSIDFEAKTVRLASAYTKNRKEAILPLRDDMLADLKKQTAKKSPNTTLFKLTDKTSEIIRRDLAGAKAHYVNETEIDSERERRAKDDFLKIMTDEGELDFHSLRHSYATLLVNGGTDVKTAQSLLRHSTPYLTLNVYSHTLRKSEQSAVDSLPSFDLEKRINKKG